MNEQQIKLEPARALDLPSVQGVLSGAARWMREERGVLDQWPEQFPDWLIEDAIARGEMFLVRAGTEIAGTVRIQNADVDAWGEDDGRAVYVHSLALRRKFSGQGLGAAILDKIQQDATAAGKPVLRLDCVATNVGLRNFYEQLGFEHRGDVVQRIGRTACTSSLFERAQADVVE
jgi:ribosomal protein S18 acetylase RimI-like enzyme